MLDLSLSLQYVEASTPDRISYVERHVEESNREINQFEIQRLMMSTKVLNEWKGEIEPYTDGKILTHELFVDATQTVARQPGAIPDGITEDEYTRLAVEIAKALKPYRKIKTNQLVTRLEFKQVSNFFTSNRLVATIKFQAV